MLRERSTFKRVHHFTNGARSRGPRQSCVCGKDFHANNLNAHQTSCEAHLATADDGKCTTCNEHVVGGIQEHYNSKRHRTHRRRLSLSNTSDQSIDRVPSPAYTPPPTPLSDPKPEPQEEDIPLLEHEADDPDGMP